MEDKGAWSHLTKAAEEMCDSSRGRGVDTRSALAGGLLGLLVSTRGGRSLIGKTLKYGVVAGLGALAWKSRRQDHEHENAYRTTGSSSDSGPFSSSETPQGATQGAAEDAAKGPFEPDSPDSSGSSAGLGPER